MNWRAIVVTTVSTLALAAVGCTTGPDAGDDDEAVQVDSTESNLTSCCVSARNGNDCWRKCDGRWKDLLSNETCSLARGDGGCRAEFRPGGGCWRRCNGRWKDLLPSEDLCRANACGATPEPGVGSGATECCVSARNGNDCWRKCDGRWKDLLSNETCALARGDGGCRAEFRPGGGCWRKCDGRWKDLLPSEELCQVNACGSTTTPPTPGTGSSSGSTAGSLTLYTFSNCDEFFSKTIVTPSTNCSDLFGTIRSVKKDGVCIELPFGTSATDACRGNRP